MRYIAIFLISFLFTNAMSAQEAGATVYGGISMGKTKDAFISKKGEYQAGYLVGLDARLNSGSLYFMLGGEYGKFDMMSQDQIRFTSGQKFTFFKGRTGLGFKLFGNEKIYLSSKVQASFDIVTNFDSKFLENTSYKINDGFLGGVTGIGLNIYALYVELEYEHGILNLYYEKPETTINFFTLKTGFKF